MSDTNAKSVATLGTNYLSRRVDRMFSNRDKDNDGALSMSEFTAQLGNIAAAGQNLTTAVREDQFKTMDKDSDGLLTKDEVSAYEKQQMNALRTSLLQMQELLSQTDEPQKAGTHKRHHAHKQPQEAGSPTISSSNIETLLKQLDGTSNEGLKKANSFNQDELGLFVKQLSSSLTSAVGGL